MPFDHARLDDLAMLGDGAREVLLRRFLGELADRPIDVAVAIAGGNLAAARDVAHYFRSGALTVGAVDVAAAAAWLERSSDDEIGHHADALSVSAATTRAALIRLIDAQLV